jgi:hypothetical protein
MQKGTAVLACGKSGWDVVVLIARLSHSFIISTFKTLLTASLPWAGGAAPNIKANPNTMNSAIKRTTFIIIVLQYWAKLLVKLENGLKLMTIHVAHQKQL